MFILNFLAALIGYGVLALGVAATIAIVVVLASIWFIKDPVSRAVVRNPSLFTGAMQAATEADVETKDDDEASRKDSIGKKVGAFLSGKKFDNVQDEALIKQHILDLFFPEQTNKGETQPV